MPSSAVLSFSEPDEYASSIRATNYQMTVTGRGQFTAELTKVDLHDLWMQRFSSNLAWVSHAENVPGRAIFAFITGPSHTLRRNSVELPSTGLLRLSDAHASYQTSSGPISWGAMSLPLEVIARLGSVMAGCDLTSPAQPTLVMPPRANMGRLLRLHATAGQLAAQAPHIVANAAAASGLEHQLIEALVDCVGVDGAAEDRAAVRRHHAVMHRFHDMAEAKRREPIYLPELCSAIGVSGRTLRACCQEALGMSPLRYLWLRRMQLARHALILADPLNETVTEIVTAHGFWELGRFAVSYRSLYGEAPSHTLARRDAQASHLK